MKKPKERAHHSADLVLSQQHEEPEHQDPVQRVDHHIGDVIDERTPSIEVEFKRVAEERERQVMIEAEGGKHLTNGVPRQRGHERIPRDEILVIPVRETVRKGRPERQQCHHKDEDRDGRDSHVWVHTVTPRGEKKR